MPSEQHDLLAAAQRFQDLHGVRCTVWASDAEEAIVEVSQLPGVMALVAAPGNLLLPPAVALLLIAGSLARGCEGTAWHGSSTMVGPPATAGHVPGPELLADAGFYGVGAGRQVETSLREVLTPAAFGDLHDLGRRLLPSVAT